MRSGQVRGPALDEAAGAIDRVVGGDHVWMPVARDRSHGEVGERSACRGVCLGGQRGRRRRRRRQGAAGDDLLDGPDEVRVLVDADDDLVEDGPGQRRARGGPEDDRARVESGGGEEAPVCGAVTGASESPNESITFTCSKVTISPARAGKPKVNQSSEWLTIRSIKTSVARWARSGAWPPMETWASSICHQRGSGALG